MTALKVQARDDLAKGDPAAIPRWSQLDGFASQAGQTPFGAIREQVTRVQEHVNDSIWM